MKTFFYIIMKDFLIISLKNPHLPLSFWRNLKNSGKILKTFGETP